MGEGSINVTINASGWRRGSTIVQISVLPGRPLNTTSDQGLILSGSGTCQPHKKLIANIDFLGHLCFSTKSNSRYKLFSFVIFCEEGFDALKILDGKMFANSKGVLMKEVFSQTRNAKKSLKTLDYYVLGL